VPGVIDQSSRSKIRIHIESLLIDINEEVFAISEELGKIFQFDKSNNCSQLGGKLQDFEKRQEYLIKKVADSVEQNPLIKYLAKHKGNREGSFSPP